MSKPKPKPKPTPASEPENKPARQASPPLTAEERKQAETLSLFGSGGGGAELELLLVNQAVSSTWPESSDERTQHIAQQASIQLARAVKPRDPFEGMLVAQMWALHSLAMENARRALLSQQTVEGVERCTNRVAKLTRSYALHLETLTKYRRGEPKQTVRVEHVNVAAGGKAIVGNVAPGGRGSDGETDG